MHFLVVDASPLIYSNFSANGHLANSKGESTGLRYGFMRSIASYVKKVKAQKVIICWDVKGPIKKAEGHTTYKANRVQTEEKRTMYAQIPDLRHMVEQTWWTSAFAEGYEADDVIAAFTRAIELKGHTADVVTTDNDLANVVSDRISVWMPPKKGEKEWRKTPTWVEHTFGVKVKDLIAWRAFVGDKSDNLTGVTTDKKIIETFRNILNSDQNESFLLDGVKTLVGEDGLTTWLTNRDIMTLHNPPAVTQIKGKNDPEELMRLFQQCEMKSMYDRIDEFTRAEP